MITRDHLTDLLNRSYHAFDLKGTEGVVELKGLIDEVLPALNDYLFQASAAITADLIYFHGATQTEVGEHVHLTRAAVSLWMDKHGPRRYVAVHREDTGVVIGTLPPGGVRRHVDKGWRVAPATARLYDADTGVIRGGLTADELWDRLATPCSASVLAGDGSSSVAGDDDLAEMMNDALNAFDLPVQFDSLSALKRLADTILPALGAHLYAAIAAITSDTSRLHGVPQAAIARQVGVTESAVSLWLRVHGPKKYLSVFRADDGRMVVETLPPKQVKNFLKLGRRIAPAALRLYDESTDGIAGGYSPEDLWTMLAGQEQLLDLEKAGQEA